MSDTINPTKNLTLDASDERWTAPMERSDPHRPRFHFLPPSGWLNDPNGLYHHAGETHLFYQHNPHAAEHHKIHWGHAVTRDLITWEHLPLALTPEEGGPDGDGCWSGGAVMHDGLPHLIYTGVHPQVQCLAVGSADGRTWRKHPGNPIIDRPPPGLNIVGDPPEIRDPYVWRENGVWRMILGSGVVDGTSDGMHGPEGVLLAYRSHDLKVWTYDGVLHRGRFGENVGVWECPNWFELDGRQVLLVSEQWEYKHTYYQVGDHNNGSFQPQVTGKMDHGARFYAALTMSHPDGRRLAWGWIKEARAVESQRDAGWSGMLSLPRELALAEDGALQMRPARELASLRSGSLPLTTGPLPKQPDATQTDALEPHLEVELDVKAHAEGALVVTLREAASGDSLARIHYAPAAGRLRYETLAHGSDATLERDIAEVEHKRPGGESELRLFIDGSVVELFLDDRTCVTGRIYPQEAAITIEMASEQGDVVVNRGKIWRMMG